MERERKPSRIGVVTKRIVDTFGRWSANEKLDNWRKIGGYCLLAYFFDLLISLAFLTLVKKWSFGAGLMMFVGLPIYALAYTGTGAMLTLIAAGALVKFKRAQLVVSGIVGWIFFSLTQLLLLADFGLFKSFGYHFNAHVWNLIRTPGGIRAMGLRGNTFAVLTLTIVLIFALNLIPLYFVLFFRGGRAALRLYRTMFRTWRKFALIAAATAFGFAAATVFAWNFYMKYPLPLRASKCIPAFRRVTMNKFFKKLGFREPTREELLMRQPYNGDNYPVRPIRRRADRPRYNVVWLVCESWRADALDPVDADPGKPMIMPRTWRFAKQHGIRFTNNFSGGNNTRMGVFSMFYGLYGSYWFPFLDVRKGALLIDWMIEDGYDIRCFSSAQFGYPEFDHTIFARLPASSLHSDDEGLTYERDTRNTAQLLEFINGDHGGRPFMAFMFFESPHYPFEFPDKNAIFRPFVDKVDYMKLGPSRAAEVKNRYYNCCRTLDGFLGQVFDALESRGMLDNTIVVVIGDHGEEFFEHGHQGHGSNFTNEQTRTPLIIHLPKVAPRVYTGMSSHLDVAAMLAPYFGVENPASEFSHGIDLLAPGAPKRRYTVITQFDESFFTGEKYKMDLPLDEFGSITARAYDAEDRELPDTGLVYRECVRDLTEIQRELNRFISK